MGYKVLHLFWLLILLMVLSLLVIKMDIFSDTEFEDSDMELMKKAGCWGKWRNETVDCASNVNNVFRR